MSEQNETEVEETEEGVQDPHTLEGVSTNDAPDGGHETPSPDEGPQNEGTPEVNPQNSEGKPDTFPRSVVEKLRRENAGYRDKARKAEQYAHELHAARVASTGRLADPSDLPFDEAHLEDMSRLEAAIDDLLQAKPHLASRRPRGDVGAGATPSDGATVDLAGILRSRA